MTRTIALISAGFSLASLAIGAYLTLVVSRRRLPW